MTLIEDDTVLVSWRAPMDPRVVVTHYTLLYASQKGWLAGRWQILQRDGELISSDPRFLCLDQTLITSPRGLGENTVQWLPLTHC